MPCTRLGIPLLRLLEAVVVVLSVAVATNLLLTTAVIRRLRMSAADQRTRSPDLPSLGTVVLPFSASVIGGGRVSLKDVTLQATIVIFLSPDCPACGAISARLREARPTDVMLVFVAGDSDPTAALELAKVLSPVVPAAVIHGADVLHAFGGVDAFPTTLRIDSGIITAAGHRLEDLSISGAEAIRP